MPADISAWLQALGLAQYAAVFAESDVDFDALRLLNEKDLQELRISLGHRKKLLKAIAELNDADDLALAPIADQPQASAEPINATTSQGERRQLTVMFCDLVNSTALSSRLDPEDLREIIHSYQAVASDVITGYAGHVAQYLGDGLLVYFGYPQAHEDDAVRAVHAGLGILAGIASLGGRLQQQLQTPLAVRIGIHSGLVVVGAHGVGNSHEGLAIGETPNIAARLQNVAAPGTIIISDTTRQLLGGQFDLDHLGAQEFKGVNQAIKIARVTGVSGATSRFAAATQSGLTPLVGRAQEIGLLTDRWQLAQEGEGQVVLISGEPGLGKSRLLSELRDALGAEVAGVLRFQCSPYYVNSAYYSLTDHLERALALPADATVEQKLTALEDLVVTGHGLPRQQAQLLAALLSIPTADRYPALTTTPQRQKEDTLAAAVALTLAVSRRGTGLMLFEDAHWADPTTLEFLDLLISRASTARLLLILTHRPEFDPKWTTHGHVAALALSRLSRTQSGAIVSRLAGGKALPAGLLEQILAKTDGVPLFVEELTRSVLESAQLRDLGDRYEYAANNTDLKVPTTLRDSLMARLDRDPLVKEIAQTGAAIGREFSYALLHAVATLDQDTLNEGLNRLTESGLAFRRGTLPAATFTFKHALVQDAAYDSLVRTRRQALHQVIANALERQSPLAKDTEPELFAHHYTAAGMTEIAIPLWQQAGSHALARVAAQEAISHLTTGLELVATLPPATSRDESELDLRVLLGAAWMMIKGWWAPEVWAAVHPALALAKSLDRRDTLGGIYYNLFANLCMRGRVNEGARWCEEALSAAALTGDAGLRTIAELLATFMSLGAGNWPAARAHAANLYRVYTAADQGYVARAINVDPKDNVDTYAGYWIWALGYPDQALVAYQAHVTNARTSNHPFFIPYGLTISAMVLDFRGEPAALGRCAEEAIQFGRDNALPVYSDLLGPMFLALATSRIGNNKARVEPLQKTIAAWQSTGAFFLVPYMKAALAEALVGNGDLPGALQAVNEGIDQIERPGWGERWWLVENLRVKGCVLEQLNELDEAERFLTRALTVAREQQAKSWELRAATTLAKLWRRQDKTGAAYELLAPIYAWFTEGFGTKDLIEAKALLDELEPRIAT